MRILSLEDIVPSLAQPLDNRVFGRADLHPPISAYLIPECGQVAYPNAALVGDRHKACDHLNWVSPFLCG
jgi:hypothetical protein